MTEKTLAGLRVQQVQERAPFLNMMIYGEAGIGKTVLAGSADDVPEMRPVLVVDIEGGTESLRRLHPGVEVVRVTSWDEMQKVYDALYAGEGGYQTVILDSLTEIQKFSMDQIMKDLVASKPDADPDVPGMREWGKNIGQIRLMVRAFRDLPMHSIFTALAMDDKDKLTGITKTKVALSGKVANEIPAFLDIVAYYYMKRIGTGEDQRLVRFLLTQATDKQVAKDRTGSLPLTIESPTMADIFAYINSTPAVTEGSAS